MKTFQSTIALVLCSLLLAGWLPAGASAQGGEAAAAPSSAEDRGIQLAVAYQAGFLNVTATACFQLYSSMGIVASDLGQGHITGATALGALEQNGLLLSVCQSSLEDVRLLTDSSDAQGLELLQRIGTMLTALGGLQTALVDAASTPRGDAKARAAAGTAVDRAREQVEAALDAYAAPLPGMP